MNFKVATGNVTWTPRYRREKAIRGLRLMARLGRMAQKALDAIERDGHYDGFAPYVEPGVPDFHGRRGPYTITPASYPEIVAEPTLDWIPDIFDIDVVVEHPATDGLPISAVRVIGKSRIWDSGQMGVVESTREDRPLIDGRRLERYNIIGAPYHTSIACVAEYRPEGIMFSRNHGGLGNMRLHRDNFHRALALTIVQTDDTSPHEMFELRNFVDQLLNESGLGTKMYDKAMGGAMDHACDLLREHMEEVLVRPTMED